MYFDSHAHYEGERFDGDRDELLKSLFRGGVDLIMNVGSDMETSRQSIELAKKYSFMYAAVGVHPHEAEGIGKREMDLLSEMTSYEKVRAIGEIGLDYHYDISPRDVQKRVFEMQLDLAKNLSLPVIIHEREAYADTLDIIRASGVDNGVFHCFSGDSNNAREVLELGFMISFTGVVTFKNARKAIDAVKYAPLDRIMIETDCPYMAPEPHRGTRCDSSLLRFTAAKIAEIKGLSLEETAQITKQNAMRFFGI